MPEENIGFYLALFEILVKSSKGLSFLLFISKHGSKNPQFIFYKQKYIKGYYIIFYAHTQTNIYHPHLACL